VVHCDVGGGYRNPALSEIALRWMVDQARSCGLAFAKGWFSPTSDPNSTLRRTGEQVVPDPLGEIHESRKGFYRAIPAHEREVGVTPRACESAASSAAARLHGRSDYHPESLVRYVEGGGEVIEV
jgi:hypothetical protein